MERHFKIDLQVLPMSRLVEGIAAVESRESIGKIVMVPEAD